jgi:hypothetical protein
MGVFSFLYPLFVRLENMPFFFHPCHLTQSPLRSRHDLMLVTEVGNRYIPKQMDFTEEFLA